MKRAWMTTGLLNLTVLGSIALSAGCVPEQKYNDLMAAHHGLEQQLIQTQGELSTARANESHLRTQLAETMTQLEALQAMAQGSGFDAAEWEKKYSDLLAKLGNLQMGPLPKELSDELARLAAEYPDIFVFDARTGMLRFVSDWTFDPGSDDLKSGANAVVVKLANILNTPIAGRYEVKVVGHTDNVPVVRTKAKFGNNLMLSAFRAASLRNALVRDGVGAQRFQIAGYGEYRPLVPNGPKGAMQNRRVELYLSPITVDSGAVADATLTATPAAPMATRTPTAPVSARGSHIPAEEPTK
jgi:flagellar motor protein MotB